MNVFSTICLSWTIWLTVQISSTCTTQAEHEEPLFLTPLIKEGKLHRARNLSRVEPLYDRIESHSGYLTVDEATKSHLFFWFFPKSGGGDGGGDGSSTKNSTLAPLILWLGGGPGMSSLIGLFQGTGPFKVMAEERLNKTFYYLEKNDYTWTRNYNMLYIDQPVGTGFSFNSTIVYANGTGWCVNSPSECVNSSEAAANHLYVALSQFFTLFPELRRHDLYIAGESYAGKFIPAIGYRIDGANKERLSGQRMRLKGMMIGNGFTDPENMIDFDVLLYSAGLIDKRERKTFEERQNEVRHIIQSEDWNLAYEEYYRKFISKEMMGAINSSHIYDYRRDDDPDDSDYFGIIHLKKYLNLSRIRRHLHVYPRPYEVMSDEVPYNFLPDTFRSMRPLVEELLERYPMLFYNGLYDIVCSPVFTENFLDHLHWKGARKFRRAKKQFWRVDGQLIGHYKFSSNLVFLTVRNAGHSVTTERPATARNMIDLFIEKKFDYT